MAGEDFGSLSVEDILGSLFTEGSFGSRALGRRLLIDSGEGRIWDGKSTQTVRFRELKLLVEMFSILGNQECRRGGQFIHGVCVFRFGRHEN